MLMGRMGALLPLAGGMGEGAGLGAPKCVQCLQKDWSKK